MSYRDSDQTVVLQATSDFNDGDWFTVSGLAFTSFTASSPLDNLELDIDENGSAEDSDAKSIRILDVTLTSGANQSFTVGDPATTANTLTITDDPASPVITGSNDLRIHVPAGFQMSWDTSVLTVTLGGSASGKASTTVSYENSGRTVVIDVTSDFGAGDQLTIDDLAFTDFAAPSAADNLELEIFDDGVSFTADDRTIDIVAGASPSILSANDQIFFVDDPATSIATITIADSSGGDITKKKDIRIQIPSSFNMIWDTSLTTATLSGNAAGNVSTTVSYDTDRILVLDVTADFNGGDWITVSGLSFTSFTAVSAADNLELDIDDNGAADATDGRFILIPNVTISSGANQSFIVGAASTIANTITISDDASVGIISKSSDIRIRIPSGLSMKWDDSVITASLGGSASAKVSTTVSYEDSGKTVVLDVTTDFVPGDTLSVDALAFARLRQPFTSR